MPATIKNCPIQCPPSIEEQGIYQVFWEVLDIGGYWDI